MVVCALCAQLFLQFYADSFETLQMSCHALKMCTWFGHNPQINKVLTLFSQFELSHLSGILTMKVN